VDSVWPDLAYGISGVWALGPKLRFQKDSIKNLPKGQQKFGTKFQNPVLESLRYNVLDDKEDNTV
jgi:hypothetical protein